MLKIPASSSSREVAVLIGWNQMCRNRNVIGVVLGVLLCTAAVFHVWREAVLRERLVADIRPNVGLVMGDLESVFFSAKSNPEILNPILGRLVERRCPSRGLGINDGELNSELIQHVRKMSWLRILDLARTNADDDLAHLRQMRNLRTLILTDTKVTDEGLRHLGTLTSLEVLGVAGTQITDAGLLHLTKLTSLRELHVGWTQVTENGLIELKKSLPNFRLEYALEEIRSSEETRRLNEQSPKAP